MTLLEIIRLIVGCGLLITLVGSVMFLISFFSCYENCKLELVSFIVVAVGVGIALIAAITVLVMRIIGLL